MERMVENNESSCHRSPQRDFGRLDKQGTEDPPSHRRNGFPEEDLHEDITDLLGPIQEFRHTRSLTVLHCPSSREFYLKRSLDVENHNKNSNLIETTFGELKGEICRVLKAY